MPLLLSSCQRAEKPPLEKPGQQVSVKACDDLTVWQDTEKGLATLRALERELTAEFEARRARADNLMRAGQDEKAIKSAVDDLHDAQEQLIKVKERLIVTERKFAELNDPKRNTKSDRDRKEQELATLQALTTELNVDLDGKEALYEAIQTRPDDLPIPEEVKAGGQTEVLRYQSEQIEKARRDYLEAQEQLLKLKERLMKAHDELRDLEKNS